MESLTLLTHQVTSISTSLFGGYKKRVTRAEIFHGLCTVGWNSVFGSNRRTAHYWILASVFSSEFLEKLSA